MSFQVKMVKPIENDGIDKIEKTIFLKDFQYIFVVSIMSRFGVCRVVGNEPLQYIYHIVYKYIQQGFYSKFQIFD